jgi:hypothetical protein
MSNMGSPAGFGFTSQLGDVSSTVPHFDARVSALLEKSVCALLEKIVGCQYRSPIVGTFDILKRYDSETLIQEIAPIRVHDAAP